MYLQKVRIFEIYISLSQLICQQSVCYKENQLSKQSLIGRIKADPDLGSIWAQLWISLGFKLIKSHLWTINVTVHQIDRVTYRIMTLKFLVSILKIRRKNGGKSIKSSNIGGKICKKNLLVYNFDVNKSVHSPCSKFKMEQLCRKISWICVMYVVAVGRSLV